MLMSKDQIEAKKTILDWVNTRNRRSFLTLGGYAGTGKTTLISEVKKQLPKSWRVAFCAYTGKAASVMKERLEDADAVSLNDYVGTIHSLCYRVREDPDTKMHVFERVPHIGYDLIVVDEASMVTEDIFRDLRMYGIPMLFVGDHGQLPPISSMSDDGAAGVFNLMENPMMRLEEVHRFGSDSSLLDISVMAREGVDIPFKVFDERVAKVKETDPMVNDFILNHLKDFSDGVCLCGTNNTRVDVNQLIRMNLGTIEDIEDKLPRIGDRVVCLKNNKSLVVPIYNGLLGRISEVSEVSEQGLEDVYSMRVAMDEGFDYSGFVVKDNFGKMKYASDGKEFITVRELMKMKSYLTIAERRKMRKMGKRKLWFDAFDFGYCLTVHKAQGSEWGNVMLFEETSGYWDSDYKNKWLYTAVTRSNDRLLIIG